MSLEPNPLDSRLADSESAVSRLSRQLEAAASANDDDSRQAALEWKLLQDLSTRLPRMAGRLGTEEALDLMASNLNLAVTLGERDPALRRQQGDGIDRIINAFRDTWL